MASLSGACVLAALLVALIRRFPLALLIFSNVMFISLLLGLGIYWAAFNSCV